MYIKYVKNLNNKENLGEWAIALHGMVLVPSGYWFQFIEI
jgi:hypothetical protein